MMKYNNSLVILKKEKLNHNQNIKALELTEDEIKAIARQTKREFLMQSQAHRVTTFIEMEE